MPAHHLEYYQKNELNSFALKSDVALKVLRDCMPEVLSLPAFEHMDCITNVELSIDGLIMCVVSVDKMITIWQRANSWGKWEKATKFKVICVVDFLCLGGAYYKTQSIN